MIQLSAQCLDAIRTEGEKAYPNECCGILLGALSDDKRLVESILPIINAREQAEQYHRFEIEPEDLLRAEKEARAQKQGCAWILPFPSGSPGASLRIRQEQCFSILFVHYRIG